MSEVTITEREFNLRTAEEGMAAAAVDWPFIPEERKVPLQPLHLVAEPQKLVYLAGPITGKTFADARRWRDTAARELGKAGIDTLSPLRGKEHLDTGRPLPNDFDGGFKAVKQDLDDIYNCDAVLAYFGDAEVASVGTCAEIGYAHGLETAPHIISVVKPSNPHDHVFIHYMSDFVARSLEDGLEIIKEMLND